MDKALFFERLKKPLFGGSYKQTQVNGLNAILDEANWRFLRDEHLAALIAEVYHETGGQMEPVKETVYASSTNRNPSDAEVIRRLDAAYAKGQLPWVKKPYWKDGWFGRGLVQITHEANYKKLGLTKETALDLKASVHATFEGMIKGLFTGKKLSDYNLVNGYDFKGSRAIINGDVPKVGPEIEKNGKLVLQALRAAGYGSAPTPVKDYPEPEFPINPGVETSTKETTSFWPALFRFVGKLLKRNAA